jgi:hypothetical protein
LTSETNTKKGPRREQKLFRDLIRSHGGFYCIVRSVEQALAALERARKGEIC